MARTKEEDALMSQIANLERQLHDKRAELLEVRIKQSGIKIGQIAVTQKGRYRIVRIEPTGWGDPWLIGNPTKKDGTFGTAEHRVYGKYTIEAD